MENHILAPENKIEPEAADERGGGRPKIRDVYESIQRIENDFRAVIENGTENAGKKRGAVVIGHTGDYGKTRAENGRAKHRK